MQRPWGGNSKGARIEGAQGQHACDKKTALSGPGCSVKPQGASARGEQELPWGVVARGDEHPRESPLSLEGLGARCGLAPAQQSNFNFSKLQLPCYWNSRFGPDFSSSQSLLFDRGTPFFKEILLGKKFSMSRVSNRQACHWQGWKGA